MPLPPEVTQVIVEIAKEQLLKIGKKVGHAFLDSVTGKKLGEIVCYRQEERNNNILLFVHGFSGSASETFGHTPIMLENNSKFAGWDIYSIGYSSDIFPSIGKGLWSVNPDITKISMYLNTLLQNQFVNYKRVAFVAHSMGGLAVQRTILDLPKEQQQKISHALFFGTPSAGLKKAFWFKFWNMQVKDLSNKSEFIKKLRDDWDTQYKDGIPFGFKSIAGTKDEFVPVTSSLEPFDKTCHAVIEGNHVSMVKPVNDTDSQHQSYTMILNTLTNQNTNNLQGNQEDINLLLGDYQAIITKFLPNANKIGLNQLTQLVFALECSGREADAIKVLQDHPKAAKDSDALGILGGRYKRKYLLDGMQDDLDKAFKFYSDGLTIASMDKPQKEQVYYHAINLAFLSIVANNNRTEMKTYALLAKENCVSEPKDMWELATIAEANLYLGHMEVAIAYYTKAAALAGTDVRAKQSMYSNAFYGYQSLMSTQDKKAEFLLLLEQLFLT